MAVLFKDDSVKNIIMEQVKEIIYADPFSLFVITINGQLKQLYTPFRVRCVMPVDRIPKTQWYMLREYSPTKVAG